MRIKNYWCVDFSLGHPFHAYGELLQVKADEKTRAYLDSFQAAQMVTDVRLFFYS